MGPHEGVLQGTALTNILEPALGGTSSIAPTELWLTLMVSPS